MKRIGLWVLLAVPTVLLAIQAVPYGRDHANPPMQTEPRWDSPRTRELAVRACFDCHSNATRWPWYSHVAPASWLVQHDVLEGRREVNFSEWDRRRKGAAESAEKVRKGSMPPWYYPWARLSPEEREDLVRGLRVTVGQRAS